MQIKSYHAGSMRDVMRLVRDELGDEAVDEFLTLMQKLWTEPVVTYQGKHIQVNGARMDPKPIQKPHIPIIVGGHSKRALRRAAELGNGWYGFGVNPEQTAAVLNDVDAALRSAGRTRDGFEVVITPNDADADTIRAFTDLESGADGGRA